MNCAYSVINEVQARNMLKDKPITVSTPLWEFHYGSVRKLKTIAMIAPTFYSLMGVSARVSVESENIENPFYSLMGVSTFKGLLEVNRALEYLAFYSLMGVSGS